MVIPELIAGVPTLLVLKQPDLGTALILGLIFISICSLTRIQGRSVVAVAVGVAVLLPVTWSYVLKDYQKNRIVSFLNPEHEARVAEIVREEFPEAFLSVSSEVLPQYREYERFSTVCLNACGGPRDSRYVRPDISATAASAHPSHAGRDPDYQRQLPEAGRTRA